MLTFHFSVVDNKSVIVGRNNDSMAQNTPGPQSQGRGLKGIPSPFGRFFLIFEGPVRFGATYDANFRDTDCNFWKILQMEQIRGFLT